MRTAAAVLNIIQERGKRKLPLEDIYRQLYNPLVYLRAYAKLYPNKGAMTPGTTPETVDAMTMAKSDGRQLGGPEAPAHPPCSTLPHSAAPFHSDDVSSVVASACAAA